MLIYRVCLTRYAKDLSGEGARINGGRWNKVGTRCVYASGSRALAVLEYAVNVSLNDMPFELSIVTINVPDEGHLELSTNDLPDGWHRQEVTGEAQNFGNSLLEKAEHIILKMPSAVIPQEYNYLINPQHPDFRKIKIVDVASFSFDKRLKQ